MPGSRKFAVLVPAALAVVALTGCSEFKQGFEEGKREAIIETVGRAAIQQAANVSLKGDLACATVQSDTGSVSCTGTTSDGRPVTLTGNITKAAEVSKSDWIKGEFLGTVDGREVLRRTCLGNCA